MMLVGLTPLAADVNSRCSGPPLKLAFAARVTAWG